MCGFIGIYGPDGFDVAGEIYEGLLAVQHRGQDAAGIVTFTDSFHVKKGLGLVLEVFNEKNMPRLRGNLGVGHVRYPTVGSGSKDDAQPFHLTFPVGVAMGQPLDITKALVRPLFVPETMPALGLLELFKQTRKHIALVVDEYGGTQGVVSLIDVLEAIVGDLPTPEAHGDEMIVRRADGSLLLDGLVPVDRFKDVFRLKALPGEDRGHFQTMGGFMMAQLARVPKVADSFEWNGYKFEVVDMDGNRVDKLMVTPLKKG